MIDYKKLYENLRVCCGDVDVDDCCKVCSQPRDVRNGEIRWCSRWLAKDAADAIEELQVAIEQLQADNKQLHYTLWGVMHSVDKWLDGDELKQSEINRAADMREKTLRMVEALQAENHRLRKQLEAAVRDLKYAIFSDGINSCTFCKHENPDKHAAPYCLADFCEKNEWQWRGEQEAT